MLVLQNTAKRTVSGVSFGPGGRTLIAGGSGGFDIWDLATGISRHIKSHDTRHIYALTADPLGRWFYFADSRGGCRMLSADGRERRLPGSQFDHHVIHLSVTADGEQVAVCRGGAGSRRLECWNVTGDGEHTHRWTIYNGLVITPRPYYPFEQGNRSAENVALTPSGDMAAAAESGDDHRRLLRYRDGATGYLRAEVDIYPYHIGGQLVFTADGSTLIGWAKTQVLLIDVATGQRTGVLRMPGRAYFNGLSVHPSARVFATVANDGLVRVWDADSVRQIRAFTWDIGRLRSVAFSPDGTLAAAGGDSGKIVIWDVDL